MKQRIQQSLLTALIIDLILHLVIFKSMASHVSENGLSWWNQCLFEGHGYPAMALDPAMIFFGDGFWNSFVMPYLTILFLVIFGASISKFIKYIFNIAAKIAKPPLVTMLDLLKKGIIFTVKLIVKKMSWLKNYCYQLVGLKVKKDTSRGSADFATKKERKAILKKGKNGVLIDGIDSIDKSMSFRHLTILAPSGQGKTSNYIIPNILNQKTTDRTSIVVTDPKGEIYEKTSGEMAKRGFLIKVINVEYPERSLTFNPLHRVRTDIEVAKVAEILLDAAFPDSDTNNFWNSSSKMILTLLLKILKNYKVVNAKSNVIASLNPVEAGLLDADDIEYYNLHNLRHLLNSLGQKGMDLMGFVHQYAPDAKTLREYKAFTMQDEKTFSNIVTTARTALKDLAINHIETLTAKDTVQFEDIRSQPTVLYLITPPSDVEYYRFFLTLFYSQLFDYCQKNEGTHDVLFLMDEFGNLGKIPSFDNIITTLRSKNCSVSLVLQDTAQLKKIYGELGASTIFNGGCSTKIIFGGIQNIQTLDNISKMLGTQTLPQTNRDGEEINPIPRPLMMPDEISRMKKGEGVLLSAGSRPIQLEMTHWENKKSPFAKYMDTPPFPLTEHKKNQVRYIDLDLYQMELEE